MKKARWMRCVAFVLSLILIMETPVTALAENGVTIAYHGSDTVSDGNDLSEELDGGDSEDAADEESAEEAASADVSVDENARDLASDEPLGDSLSENAVQEALMEESAQEDFAAEEEEDNVAGDATEDDFVEGEVADKTDGSEEGEGGLYLTRELTGERTENSLTYERSDHSITTYVYSAPVSYQTDDDEWRLIDNRLCYSDESSVDDDFSGYTNTAAAFDVRFAEEANEERILTFESNGNEILLAYVPVGSSAKSDNTNEEVIAESSVSGDRSNKTDEVSDETADKADSSNDDQTERKEEDDQEDTDSEEFMSISSNEVASNATDAEDDSSNVTQTGGNKWSRKISLIDSTNSSGTNPITPTENSDMMEALGVSADSSVDSSAENADFETDSSNASHSSRSIDESADKLYPELPRSQTVLYYDIEPGVDLRYELLSDGIKETIVLRKADVSSAYQFRLEIGRLTAEKTEDGGIYLCDEAGNPVMEIPAPVVTDAAGADDCVAFYDFVVDDDGRMDLTVSINDEWLDDESRVFPVEIDPTIKRYRRYKSLANLGDFVSVCSDGTKDSETLKVGRTSKNKKNVTYRSFMNPKLPKVDTGCVVTEAKMRISAGSASQVFYCIPVPNSWSVDSISSSRLPVNKNSLKNISDFGKNDTVILDITKDVKEIAAGRKNAYGWCFVSSDETENDVRTVSPYQGTDKPFLEISYKDFTGTESYFSTHSQSVGNAGVGSINDYTGRLSFAHTDARSVGERMTLSLAHVYDIAYGARAGEEKWLAADDNTSAYGAHYRLSTDVRLLVPAGETDVKTYPYVYIDSDGTKHYFKKANVTYYVNGEKKEASKSNGTYPSAKDEDGLGLFVVPVTSKNLSGTYPLKIVNKSGSSAMYFDKNGYLCMIMDSNQREDGNNSAKKDRNAVTIDYAPGKKGSSAEHSALEQIENAVRNYYDKDIPQDEMMDKALEFISEIESFERESLNTSVRYKLALNLQEARESLQKIADGDSVSNYKKDFTAAADSIRKALGEAFDAAVYVPVKLTDAAGISAELSYDENGRLVSVSDPYEGGGLITYSYDNKGNLSRIDHSNGIYAVYSYDTSGHLIRAVDESGYRMDYVYGVNGKETTDQVVKFTEYVGKKAGQSVLINYDEFNETAYTYSGPDEKINTKDDIEYVYSFDHKGRTVSTYSRIKKTKEVIGSSIRSYTDDDGDDTSAANKIKEAAATGSQVINLLTDSGFEKEAAKNGAPAWDTFLTDSTKGNSVSRSTSQKYMGSKSGYVKLSAGEADKQGGFSQTISVPASGTYTASVYIHTKGLTAGTRAGIKLSSKKSSSESGEERDSEEDADEEDGSGDGDAEDDADTDADGGAGDETAEEGYVDADSQPDINNGWKRIEVSIKASKGESITLTLSLSGKSGEAWFDCAQLEKGNLSNQYNMLPNGSFEDGFKENTSLPGLPSGWAYGAEAVKETDSATDDDAAFPEDNEEAAEAESEDEADTAAVKIVNAKTVGDSVIEGDKVLMISGNPIKRRSVIINPNFGPEKASYTFSCYVKADCAPLTGKRKCGIYVRGDKASYNEDNATGKYVSISGASLAYTEINTQTDGWQFVAVSLPVKNWKGKLIEIRFDYEVGNLYIDGCMLSKNEVVTKTYTSGGKLKTEQKGERTTTYASDGRERRKKETTAGGATTAYSYDGVTNDLTTEKHTFKQADGSKTLTSKYTYDKYGNITEVSESDSSISQKIVTGTEYDKKGRFAISNIDSRGYSTSTVYDEDNGQILSSTDAKNIETSYSYDYYHQPTGVLSAGNSISFGYNSKMHDQLKTITIGDGKESESYSFAYDAYGNTKSITRAAKDKRLVSYAHMPNNGKLKSVSYGNGNKITFGYNALEQLISESWSGKDKTEYEYDNRGNKARITDALSGLSYRYYYDEQNRITTAEVTKKGGKTSGELISFHSIYDKAGRQSVFAYYTGDRAYRSEYGYTSDDRISAATLPSGGVFGRTYDGFGRIAKDVYTPHAKAGTEESKAKKDGAAVTASYGYLNTNRVPGEIYDNKTKYSYTTRLLSDVKVTVGSGKSAQTAVSESLSYDELGRISTLTAASSAYAALNSLADSSQLVYTYDDLGRLIKAEETAGTKRVWEYSYDAIGNITASSYTDENGEVHADSYSYDKDNLTAFNGEKVSGYKGGNPSKYLDNTLKWSRGRQLDSVTPSKNKQRTEGAQMVSFTYAYDGSRLSKTVGKTGKSTGTTTEYILNGSMILAQNTTYADGETETLNFYYSPDGKLLEIGYLKNGNENHYSVVRNSLGDVAALYSADGRLVGSYAYDPYGRILSVTANPDYEDTDGILEKNPFRYRGYYYDNETGWYYLQSRYYDPTVKRFINADSTELLTTDCVNLMQYNLFMYCNGDPVNNTDSNGHIAIESTLGIFILATIVLTAIVIIVNNANAVSNHGGYVGSVDFDIFTPTNLIFEGIDQLFDWGETNTIYEMEEHTKNARPSTYDKHTKPRPGRDTEKKKQKKNWKRRK